MLIGQNQDYLDLNLNYAVDVVEFATISSVPRVCRHKMIELESGLLDAHYPTLHRKSDRKLEREEHTGSQIRFIRC